MAKVKLKETMEGNRRNVICGGRRLTVYKGAYQSIPDSWIKEFNPEQYDIITDGDSILKEKELIKKEIKAVEKEIEKIKEDAKPKITLKSK